jgi:transcription antitermination protein NusB
MLSRRHIRVKVMQALYMYYNDYKDNRNVPQVVKALDKNIDKLYELYLYFLIFLGELGHFIAEYDEEVKSRYIQNERESLNSLKFFQNPVLQTLMNSEVLKKAAKKYHIIWNGDKDLLRRIFLDLKNQELYKDYLSMPENNTALNYEVLTFVLRHYLTHFPVLQQHFEEEFYNWYDDKKVALQMASKTLHAIAEDPEHIEFLLPLSKNDDENYKYAEDLLKSTIAQDEKLEKIIAVRITKWEPHMVAMIDNIILKMAVCEFLNFPSIPSKVSINEYIELAKTYSTPQSKKFVNGVLDAIWQELKKEGKLLKS